jgi:hypothetical protein
LGSGAIGFGLRCYWVWAPRGLLGLGSGAIGFGSPLLPFWLLALHSVLSSLGGTQSACLFEYSPLAIVCRRIPSTGIWLSPEWPLRCPLDICPLLLLAGAPPGHISTANHAKQRPPAAAYFAHGHGAQPCTFAPGPNQVAGSMGPAQPLGLPVLVRPQCGG